MNKLVILIALIFWLITSLILVCSVIGLLLFVRSDHNVKTWEGDEGSSTWAKIGITLTNNLIK